MSKKRILYISQEIAPYVEGTDIANTTRLLPEYIQQKKHDIRIFMPKYGSINERRNQLHEVIRLSGDNICIDNRDYPIFIKVASIQVARMQVYFINNEEFFKRKTDFGPAVKGGDNDNDERSIFFVRAVLETVKKLRWVPDIIHCHGGFTALAMLYLRKLYSEDPTFADAKLVFSMYKEERGFEVPNTLFKKLDFDKITSEDYASMQGETDANALIRLATQHADALVIGGEGIDPKTLDYVKASGKPLLEATEPLTTADAYHDFYAAL